MKAITDNNIYKSIIDAGIYSVLYIVIPISQFIAYIINGDKGRFWCVFLLLVSILYDCYTRFDDATKIGKKKILSIGISTFIMIIITIVLSIFVSNDLTIDSWAYLLYLPILITVCVNVWDFIGRLRMLIEV